MDETTGHTNGQTTDQAGDRPTDQGPAETLTTSCCIAGGGPAGMMLGLLLARAGVDVLLLEKHRDFLRDFRGDTIHPSTLELMHELGLLERFLALPHQESRRLDAVIGGQRIDVADFTRLPTRCRFLAFMPQWDFLNFLAEQAAHYPTFGLRTSVEVDGLITEGGRVRGVRARTASGRLDVRADLIIGADGRGSAVRAAAGLPRRELGAPMDVLWFRISRGPGDPVRSTGFFDAGRILITLNRGDYWQLGYVIPKGSLAGLHAGGLPAFQAKLVQVAPFLAGRVAEIGDWTAVQLLTVRVDRLRRWYRPGLLCIGDAAHAMSPVGGVGVNLAVQDAVAAANLLAAPLREGRLTEAHLHRVQRRRQPAAALTQAGQVAIQNRLIRPVLTGGTPAARHRPPLAIRLFARTPALARIPARLIGIGIRPEHIRTERPRSGNQLSGDRRSGDPVSGPGSASRSTTRSAAHPTGRPARP